MDVAKEIATRVVKASVRAGAHTGDLLGPHVWPGKVILPGKLADWPAGIDYAVRQGWIEKTWDDQYRLTAAGFATVH